MNKRYFWLKLQDDFFDSKEIKKLRKIAGGDTYVIIYLKLQVLSLKNDGVIVLEGFEDTIEEELALEIDEDVDNIRFLIMYMEKYRLIEVVNGEMYMKYAINNIGSETDVARRVREHRKRKALQSNKKALQSNEIELLGDGDETEEIPEEIEEEEEPRENKNIYDADEKIIKFFNSTCSRFPKITKITNDRRFILNEWFLETKSFNEIKKCFEMAQESDFLIGKEFADFDWIINPKNRVKILEGKYKNNGSAQESQAEARKKRILEKARAIREGKENNG